MKKKDKVSKTVRIKKLVLDEEGYIRLYRK